jgi:hypothetical protein
MQNRNTYLLWPTQKWQNLTFFVPTLEKFVGLTGLFGLDATIRQTYVVMCKRRFVSGFCATMSTESGVSCNFLF